MTGAVPTLTAADVANGNKFTTSNDVLLIIQNSGASTRTVTITSQPLTDFARTGDVTALSIAAGQIRCFRLTKNGWANSSNEIALSANHADIKFGILDLKKAA